MEPARGSANREMSGEGAHSSVQRRQVRRAWAFLTIAFCCWLIVCTGGVGAGYWYRGHATMKQVAKVEVVQGDRAFIRPAFQRNWNALPPRGSTLDTTVELHEGDTLQTLNGTHVLLTFWDSSTVEVFERTELQVTELRTTQYISRASTISLIQTRGLVRVALAPGDYSRSRFQVLAGTTTVLMKEGDGRTGGGSFVVQMIPGEAPDEAALATVRASVRRGVGAVRVVGYPGELRLAANEQTTVPPNGAPGDPAPARRDLVANGRFDPTTIGGSDSSSRFTPWTSISTPGQVDGGLGRLTAVDEEIDGQHVNALEISRSMSSIDPAITGLRQTLDVTVTDLSSLLLTADLKVLEQNVPGGGQAGSEFPIIVRVNYYDASGAISHRVWGFYVLPGSGAPPRDGKLVPVGDWVPLRVDLRDLVPQPVRLESIEIYASGHGYRARITNVTIVGAE